MLRTRAAILTSLVLTLLFSDAVEVDRATSAVVAVPLDVETIAVELKTADDQEIDYLRYLVTLVEQKRLSRKLFDSTFQWARVLPAQRRPFQYFKRAVITLAAKQGVTLATEAPDLTPTVTGRVATALIPIPVFGATVEIEKLGLSTKSDLRGRYVFSDVPFGVYTITATSPFGQKGTAQVILPTNRPWSETASVEIRVR